MTGPQIEHVLVVIPALDEVDTIGAAVASVRAAIAALPAGVTAEIALAVDRLSRDETAAVARRSVGANGRVLVGDFGSVGAARRYATEVGLAASPAPLRQTWLATTDADSVVPRRWLADQLVLAAGGATAIAGIVELHEPPPPLARRFADHYVLHADGTHPHVHGANLGVRADLYLAAGGWRDRATGEDHDLWRRIREHSPVVHTTEICVSTSARRHGRAPAGFAADLEALGDPA